MKIVVTKDEIKHSVINDDEGDYIMHYGVKGMKWGVSKRYQRGNGKLNKRGVKKVSKWEAKEGKTLIKKDKTVSKQTQQRLVKSERTRKNVKRAIAVGVVGALVAKHYIKKHKAGKSAVDAIGGARTFKDVKKGMGPF